MRIVYLSPAYTTHDRRFLDVIARAHEALFLRLETRRTYETRPLPDGVRELPSPGLQVGSPAEAARAAPRVAELIRAARPDLLHAGPLQSCGLIAARSGVHPLAVMSWGYDVLVDADRGPEWRAAACEAVAGADTVLCDSDVVRERLGSLCGVGTERIVQFPWGVDLRAFAGTDGGLRARLGWQDAVVVISLRSHEPAYAVDVAVDAFAEAHRRDPRLRLLLLGEGSETARLRERVAALGPRGAVYAPGAVAPDRLPRYLAAADVYLSCSRSDGTSVSLLEALASGLPAVVTDNGSGREWIEPGANGWLVPADDRAGFASALVTAAALAPDERRRTRERARATARTRADWTHGAALLLRAYDRARVSWEGAR